MVVIVVVVVVVVVCVGGAYRETSGSRHFSSPAGDLWRLEGKEGWDDGMDHG